MVYLLKWLYMVILCAVLLTGIVCSPVNYCFLMLPAWSMSRKLLKEWRNCVHVEYFLWNNEYLCSDIEYYSYLWRNTKEASPVSWKLVPKFESLLTCKYTKIFTLSGLTKIKICNDIFTGSIQTSHGGMLSLITC